MGGWANIFVFLAGEDVDADHVDLGVAVLAGLGGGHFDDLAGTPLQHDVTVFAQRRALHREGCGRTGVSGLEVGILHFGHGWLVVFFLDQPNEKQHDCVFVVAAVRCVDAAATAIYTEQAVEPTV